MKNFIYIAASFLCASQAMAATTFSHFSGDNGITSTVTTASYFQVVEVSGSSVNASYTGALSGTRAGTNAFFNEAVGGLPTSTRFSFGVDSTGGTSTIDASGTNDVEVTIGAGVTQVQFTLDYVGQFNGGPTFDEGFTGRWSFSSGSPGTNFRGATMRNLSGTEQLNFAITSQEFGGATDSLLSTDFYEGSFAGANWQVSSGVSGFGTGSVNGDFNQNEGLYFHNGSDFADRSDSITFTITATGGGAIQTGTLFRFTFDAMTSSVAVPEPGVTALFLPMVIGLLYRKRKVTVL